MSVIDDYIETEAPEQARERLRVMRDLIRDLLPDAEERIAYRMPTWYLNGNVVHIGGFADHVSLFPGAVDQLPFADELAPWLTGRGTLAFPLADDLPLDVVRRVVTARGEQNRAKRAKR